MSNEFIYIPLTRENFLETIVEPFLTKRDDVINMKLDPRCPDRGFCVCDPEQKIKLLNENIKKFELVENNPDPSYPTGCKNLRMLPCIPCNPDYKPEKDFKVCAESVFRLRNID